MSEEEFEIIQRLFDMVGAAGDGAFWLAIFWLGQGYFTAILWFITATLLGFFVYKIVNTIATAACAWNDLRREAKCSRTSGDVHWDETKRVFELIRRGVEAERKEKEK